MILRAMDPWDRTRKSNQDCKFAQLEESRARKNATLQMWEDHRECPIDNGKDHGEQAQLQPAQISDAQAETGDRCSLEASGFSKEIPCSATPALGA